MVGTFPNKTNSLSFLNFIILKKKTFILKLTSPPLHTATVPAVRAAVKTQLSYRNDTIIAFLLVVNKIKEHVEVALACLSFSLLTA